MLASSILVPMNFKNLKPKWNKIDEQKNMKIIHEKIEGLRFERGHRESFSIIFSLPGMSQP